MDSLTMPRLSLFALNDNFKDLVGDIYAQGITNACYQ